mmetsp:Transcript_19812/g.31731  ORF Transcript_19812/g.31731 Transcript_19812/m.31731 type:complete len:250 (-) Transcript_19812:762-1511(-)
MASPSYSSGISCAAMGSPFTNAFSPSLWPRPPTGSCSTSARCTGSVCSVCGTTTFTSGFGACCSGAASAFSASAGAASVVSACAGSASVCSASAGGTASGTGRAASTSGAVASSAGAGAGFATASSACCLAASVAACCTASCTASVTAEVTASAKSSPASDVVRPSNEVRVALLGFGAADSAGSIARKVEPGFEPAGTVTSNSLAPLPLTTKVSPPTAPTGTSTRTSCGSCSRRGGCPECGSMKRMSCR